MITWSTLVCSCRPAGTRSLRAPLRASPWMSTGNAWWSDAMSGGVRAQATQGAVCALGDPSCSRTELALQLPRPWDMLWVSQLSS